MTAIASTPIPLAPDATPSASGSAAAGLTAGPSFGDTLMSLLDRAIAETSGRLDDRFAAGTMRSSVERFDERGFFEDRAVTDPHEVDSPLASGSTTVPTAPQQPLPAAGSLPQLRSDLAATPDAPQSPLPPTGPLRPLQSDAARLPIDHIPPVSLPAVIAAGMLASDLASGSQTIVSGLTATASLPPRSAEPQASVPIARASTVDMPVEGSAPQEGPPRTTLRSDPALAASRLKVSLDHTETGVAVSVVADVEPDSDAGAIHEKVAHMLARHGLVLSELRVTRRPGADAQDRKD